MYDLIAKRLSRDRLFGLALAAGPLAWLVLVLTGLVGFSPSPAADLPPLLLLVLVYPVMEELVFRLGIQGWLRRCEALARTWGGVTGSNIIASILFASFHLFYQTAGWGAAVFFPSLVFGFFLDRYNSVLPGILLHVWYNAGLVIFLVPV